MNQRIKEIMTELWETHLEYKNSRPEAEKGYLILPYTVLFSESVSCWRGEQAGKKKEQKQSEPATEKQVAYAQLLADKKKININITGNETKQEISKLIEELR